MFVAPPELMYHTDWIGVVCVSIHVFIYRVFIQLFAKELPPEPRLCYSDPAERPKAERPSSDTKRVKAAGKVAETV